MDRTTSAEDIVGRSRRVSDRWDDYGRDLPRPAGTPASNSIDIDLTTTCPAPTSYTGIAGQLTMSSFLVPTMCAAMSNLLSTEDSPFYDPNYQSTALYANVDSLLVEHTHTIGTNGLLANERRVLPSWHNAPCARWVPCTTLALAHPTCDTAYAILICRLHVHPLRSMHRLSA